MALDLGSIIRDLGSDGAPAGSTICIDLKEWFVDHAIKHDASNTPDRIAKPGRTYELAYTERGDPSDSAVRSPP